MSKKYVELGYPIYEGMPVYPGLPEVKGYFKRRLGSGCGLEWVCSFNLSACGNPCGCTVALYGRQRTGN